MPPRILIVVLAASLSGCSSCDGAERIEQGRHAVDHGREAIERGRAAVEDTANGMLDDDAEDIPPERAAPPPPVRPGNRAELLTNGEASFVRRMQMIDEAQRSILVQALIFKADSVGTAMARRLIERKRANPDLDIRVIVDAYANIQDYAAQVLYFELMDAGIVVQGYEPLYLGWINEIDVEDWAAGNKRYHEKYFVVDGERAVVGGMNIADEYARNTTDPAMIWRDQDIYLEGPVVADVTRAFDENFTELRRTREQRPALLESDGYWNGWRHIHPELRAAVMGNMGRDAPWRRDAPPPPLDLDALGERAVDSPLQDDVSVRFIRSRPRVGERWIQREYLAQIEAARTSAVIENAYFIPTDELRNALAGAARRGVAVTLITNSKDTNDIPMINDAGRVHYAALIAAGVRIHEWHGERHGEGTLHAKLAVFDSEVAIVGSYNLDPRSLALNSEDVVVVHDARIASELHDRVMETDLGLTERVTAAQAEAWSHPELIPALDRVPRVPWWDPRFDRDRFELFLIGQAGRML